MELDKVVEARGVRFPIRGRYDPVFRPVVEAFIENFRVEEELGAGCSVVIDGKAVVDLWGGWAAPTVRGRGTRTAPSA